MDNKNRTIKINRKRFYNFVAVGVIVGLVISYFLIDYVGKNEQYKNNVFITLVENTIPSIVAVLLGYLSLGLFTSILEIEEDGNKESKETNYLMEKQSNLKVIEGYYEDVSTSVESREKWEALIAESKSITIVAYYLNFWINMTRKSIKTFFSSGGKIKIIVSDPTYNDHNKNSINDNILEGATKGRTRKKINEAIYETYTLLSGIIDEINRDENKQIDVTKRIEFYLSPKLLTYFCFLFDDSIAAISLVEISREDSSNINTPLIILNREESSTLKTFFDKEITALTKNIDPCNEQELKSRLKIKV